jgi:peptidoglycan-N-acetylglucosamine deacetylase
MANRMLQRLRKGGIVLLHDRLNNAPETRYFDRKPMIAAVRILLETLSGEYRFVTIPELLKAGRPRRENWYWPPDVDWLHTLRDADGQTRTYSVAGGRS